MENGKGIWIKKYSVNSISGRKNLGAPHCHFVLSLHSTLCLRLLRCGLYERAKLYRVAKAIVVILRIKNLCVFSEERTGERKSLEGEWRMEKGYGNWKKDLERIKLKNTKPGSAGGSPAYSAP